MAEALACGTPVVASPWGAPQEIVEPGRTGYLYQEVDDLALAVSRVGEIDRRACGAAAEQRFSMDRMVADHVRLYQRLINQAHARLLATPTRSLQERRSDRALSPMMSLLPRVNRSGKASSLPHPERSA
jgi:hypothetical protein